MTECCIGPSGVFATGHSHHVSHILWSFHPLKGSHVSPESSLRNNPCGEPPRYQVRGSCSPAGVSQNAALRLRPSGSPSENAGGRVASRHVSPMSVERNTVGPRCPVRIAASNVVLSRGSSTTC